MKLLSKKKLVSIMCATLLPAAALGAVFYASQDIIRGTRASTYNCTLDENNSPSLSNGEGTMTDEKNVTWEYHDAFNNSNGHVSLNHDGYFGVSSSTIYGYTGIESITATFSGQDNELWLLTSVDGINWNEQEILTSDTSTQRANNWRYIRFYNYSDSNASIDISSITIGYGCTGISASDDVDGCRVDNIKSSLNLNAENETENVSPLGNSTNAIAFTKIENTDSYSVIGLNKTYALGDVKRAKVEFDYYHTNNTKPNVSLMNSSTNKVVGTTQGFAGNKTAYKVTNINSNWWHIEVPIVALAPTPDLADRGMKDVPIEESATFDSVKINNGNCVIDNLRIDSTPSSLGLFNNGTSIKAGNVYWMKVSWVGILHSATFTFDTPDIIRHEDLPEGRSQFYLRGLSAGTVVVTATLKVGYNRQTLTIQNTLTVTAS